MKSFRDYIIEDGAIGGGMASGGALATTNTKGVSGAGDNPSGTVPVSKQKQAQYVKAGKSSQPNLRHRQAKVNMVVPAGMHEDTPRRITGAILGDAVEEEMKYNQQKITKANSSTEKKPTPFAVGDSGHLGFAIKGGIGFRGKISKIQDGMVTIKSHSSNKFGSKEFRGPADRFTKD